MSSFHFCQTQLCRTNAPGSGADGMKKHALSYRDFSQLDNPSANLSATEAVFGFGTAFLSWYVHKRVCKQNFDK
ncbi:hypothetical protein APA386B_2598 [Acetobacter pasteurianus 386B]|nr:hypothetical protein APA386B_2598 [Acetobacter pasteurianus 386B]